MVVVRSTQFCHWCSIPTTHPISRPGIQQHHSAFMLGSSICHPIPKMHGCPGPLSQRTWRSGRSSSRSAPAAARCGPQIAAAGHRPGLKGWPCRAWEAMAMMGPAPPAATPSPPGGGCGLRAIMAGGDVSVGCGRLWRRICGAQPQKCRSSSSRRLLLLLPLLLQQQLEQVQLQRVQLQHSEDRLLPSRKCDSGGSLQPSKVRTSMNNNVCSCCK